MTGTKRLAGVLASMTLLGPGMVLAQQQEPPRQEVPNPTTGGGTGGLATQPRQEVPNPTTGGGSGGLASQPRQQEIAGTVVKRSSKELRIRTEQGIIIPVKISRDTRVDDPSLKHAKDVKEGQQVRVSFEVQGEENVARTVVPNPSTGGGTGGLRQKK